jgi:copper chaperone
MKTVRYKTNIKCAACVEKVTPSLNETVGKDNWKVDISNPEKILTVEGEVNEEKMKEALQKVGYRAERQ